MLRDNKHINDLEYLAQQGFEKSPASDADVSDLVKKIKTRSFSYNSGAYFGFISLLAGIFIGASLFFAMDHPVADVLASKPLPAMPDTSMFIEKDPVETLQLDTITIIKENFINPRVKTAVAKNENSPIASASQADSVISIPEKPVNLALLSKEPFKEERIKFIVNAPVLYIHDLKITNYTTLYFRKNHFVKFNERPGISADRAGKYSFGQNANQLKESADYFLHEEIAKALLYFKKGKYDDCINSLKVVSTYNDEDVNCDFYLGMCYYYKKNYAKATELFDKCIGNLNNTFLQEAMYYKATALFEAGDKNEAMPLFKQIADEGEFYAEAAKGYFR